MSTRSELKENILASKLEAPLAWVLRNLPAVLIGLGVIVVAGLVASVLIIRRQQTAETSWTRMAMAEALRGQKSFDQAKAIYTEIRNTLPRAAVGRHAQYYLGVTALEEKKYDEAAESFQRLISETVQSPLLPLAQTNLAFALEQKKDYAQSAAAYQTFMEKYPDHYLAAHNQLALGRTRLLSGDAEGAKAALTQLIDLYPTSAWAEKARPMMDKLQSR